MNAKRILCPIDFSEFGDLALGYASTLAKEAGATLHLVYVDDSQVPYDVGFAGYVGLPSDSIQWEQKLREKRPTKEGVPFVHEVLYGYPAEVLVQYARDHEIDLIVMGTHGRTGISRLLMGSVAEQMVREAPCPVLTVKQPAAVPA